MLIPVILEGCSLKKDKSGSIRFTTCAELTAEQNAEFFKDNGQAGILYWRASEEQPNVEELDNIEIDLYEPKKSPSKRIRNVIFKYQEYILGRKPTEQEFKDFYTSQCEKIIQQFKDKLE